MFFKTRRVRTTTSSLVTAFGVNHAQDFTKTVSDQVHVLNDKNGLMTFDN